MTGKIKFLSTLTRSGQIEDNDGLRLLFDFSDVLAYDIPHLAIGQHVIFTQESGKARNVSRGSSPTPVITEARRGEASLRYVGFDQANAVRTFSFERAR